MASKPLDYLAAASSRQILASQLQTLMSHVLELEKQMAELRREVSEPMVRALVEKVVEMRSDEISKVTNDAVKALRLLIDAGTITQAQANEAIQ